MTGDVGELGASILGMMWEPAVAPKLLPLVQPEYFERRSDQILWTAMAAVVARGDQLEFSLLEAELKAQGRTLAEAGGIDWIGYTLGAAPGVSDPRPQAKLLRDRWGVRTLQEYCLKTVEYLAEGRATDGGRRMAEHLASKALGLYADQGVASPRTRDELLDELWAESLSGADEQRGINFHWKGVNEEIGPLAPGEVMGISAYSGGGKTTLACNIAEGALLAGTPTVIFGTEMGKRWIARMAAIHSRTSQWCAEKRIWKRKVGDTWVPWPEGLSRYHAALKAMRRWPMEVVTSPNVTPQEVLTRSKVLRRKYPGQHVLVIVDHLHRLDYGGEDPSRMVGQATRDFKNTAAEDPDGLSFVLLYQPRKPEDVWVTDRPVNYHQIRGDALVGNELDTHISPYRSWVETEAGLWTPWGTPKARQGAGGLPVLAPRPADTTAPPAGVKLSDEHVFIANDKRRIDGPGPYHILDLHKPSGRMSEGKEEAQLRLE